MTAMALTSWSRTSNSLLERETVGTKRFHRLLRHGSG